MNIIEVTKKVFPNAFESYGIEGVLNPVFINVTKVA